MEPRDSKVPYRNSQLDLDSQLVGDPEGLWENFLLLLLLSHLLLGVVVYTFNSSPWEAEAGGFLRAGRKPSLHNELQSSYGYTVGLSLKTRG